MEKGTLFIVSAPSGAGKSSLINALLTRFNLDDKLRLSVSHTTRDPRPGEEDHISYHFVTTEEFEALIARNAFYEYAKVFDNYYGTSREIVESWLNEGKDVFLDIDWQGARQIRKITPEAKGIFIVPPSLEELNRRLVTRATDSKEVIEKRMSKAVNEISHFNDYDYVLVYDDFEETLLNLRSIVLAKRNTKEKKEASIENLFFKAK